MKLKTRDLVEHETGVVATVLKTYKNLEDEQEYVQGFTKEGKIIYAKMEQFKPIDCLLLRCNTCNEEKYEYDLDVKEDSQLYVCECGSSTFTPLNIDLEENYI